MQQMNLQLYEDAIGTFRNLKKTYPKSESNIEGMYETAMAQKALGRAAEARQALEETVEQYPDNYIAFKSKNQLGAILREKGEAAFKEADPIMARILPEAVWHNQRNGPGNNPVGSYLVARAVLYAAERFLLHALPPSFRAPCPAGPRYLLQGDRVCLLSSGWTRSAPTS